MASLASRDMGLLSMTEMLLKELEADKLTSCHSPPNMVDEQAAVEEYLQSRDACTPPPQYDWQSVLLKSDDNMDLEPRKTHSFMEILEGEVNSELNLSLRNGRPIQKTGLSQMNDMIHASAVPTARSRPRPTMPPPPLVTIPPPSILMSAPPPRHHSLTVPPPMMGTPPVPRMRLPLPMTHMPPPMMNNAIGNVPYIPMMVPNMHNYQNAAMFNHNYQANLMYSKSGMMAYPNIPISAARIPDTTLATQIKNRKKKRQRKYESNDNAPDTSKPPSPPPLNILPALPPPLPEQPPPPPSPTKSLSLKHVKEHKLVMKVEKRTLKEPIVQPINNDKNNIVAEYDSKSDEESERIRTSKIWKKSLHDPITSLRLGENEALPDLYSKLRKLNKELALLKDQDEGSHSSSTSSDEDEVLTKYPRAVDDKTGMELADEVLMPAGSVVGPHRPNLDIRIKMMMNDKNAPSPVRKSTLPPSAPIGPSVSAHSIKNVPLPSQPPMNLVQQNKLDSPENLIKPLPRPPSPYLSKDIYHYWFKESFKFRKIRKKTALPHVDPSLHHKFNKSRVMPIVVKPLGKAKMPKSEMGLSIYSMLDKKLNECSKMKRESERNKAILSEEINVDLKRLEEINKELKMLEQVENSDINEDNDLNKEDSDDNFEDADDLRRLEQITRELKMLEEEEEENTNIDINSDKENDLQCSMNRNTAHTSEAAVPKWKKEMVTNDESENCGLQRGKRKADDALISLVMSSVMDELKKDLRNSLTSSMINDRMEEYESMRCKKIKTEV